MDQIIGKINKLSLPATILIVSIILGSIFYASEVSKQRSIERQQGIKLQEEKTKAEQVKQEKEQVKQALDACLATADSNYSDNWYRECKSEDKLTDRCISLHEMTFDDYAKQNNIPSLQENIDKRLKAINDFFKERSDCSCRLLLDNADRINKTLQDDKDECFRKYPQK